MNNKNLTRQMFFLPALLAVWLILSSAFLVWFDPAISPVIILFMAVSCVLCLSHHLRVIGWILAVVGSALYIGLTISMDAVTGDEIRLISLGAVSLLGAAVLSTFTAEQLNSVATQIRYSRKMIEELRIIDPVSGLIRFHYARKNLNTEVARSLRYKKNLCLIIARVADWNDIVEHKGPDASQQIMAQVGDQLRKSIRNTDIATINIEKIGVILPETRIEGAVRVAQRIVENCSLRTKTGMNIGIASFPDDAEVDSDLIRCAEAALQISMTSGQPVVLFSQIREELKFEPPTLPARRVRPAHPETVPPRLEEFRIPAGDSARRGIKSAAEDSTPEPDYPPTPSYLSGQAAADARQDMPEVRAEEDGRENGISELVQPYRPPSSNLVLETKGDAVAETINPRITDSVVPVGIHGVVDISELPEIEKALMDIPSITGVKLVDFSRGTLILSVSHTTDRLLDEIQSHHSFASAKIRGGAEWIDIDLSKPE